ncbi:MAG: aminotransferase class I/II-fold pyridoxal phosphate-dependent enzyme, partial [Clostridiales bacterium]|nr:aminotransferase class I/II-fold pyridoxal phosphate-dependent enzyme [Clostridiales bacterium]
KVILFGYPNNPTGAIMQKEDWEDIAPLFIAHDILVISDEVYSELTYGSRGHFSIAALPGMYGRTIVMNGFSKAYAMTGWRLGYACGPADIIAAMVKIHQYVIMCAPTVAQYAGIDALRNGRDGVAEMRKDYDRRRRYLLDGFEKMGIECFEPRGAFYTFPSIKKTGFSSEDFCTRLLMEERLAVVPGTAFGECGEGYIRCCYAYSIEELKEALSRLGRFVHRYGMVK